jgi:hypothetical protein
MPSRTRGSIVDTVSLQEYPFMFEPKLRDSITTKFARQAIIGRRLPRTFWVGAGESGVSLDVYLLGNPDAQNTVQGIKALADPQDDIGAPHPVFVNVGGLYTGLSFVLVAAETDFVVFEWTDDMTPREAKMKLRFLQLAPSSTYSGAGK